MPLKTRFTPSGKAKQKADELMGWGLLQQSVHGTGSQGEVDGVVTVAGVGGPGALNKTGPAYPRWREAHRVHTARARRERQRLARLTAAGLPNVGAADFFQVSAVLNVRQTLRIAILCEDTSEGHGTTINGAAGQSINHLLQHLKKILTSIEDELNVRLRHREDHDLQSSGQPPTKVFLGPEWYFRPPGTVYSAAEHAQIIQGLEALSRSFPDWLIIPGSIYWTPDPLANATVKVFNQAPVLFAGEVIRTRTKLNSHDIDGPNGYKERWGPDNPPLPAAIAAPSMTIARFAHKNLEWCLDICRDHTVGEAMDAYVTANHAGADVYLLTANGTTIVDYFLPVHDDGLFLQCDGRDQHKAVHRVTRPTGLAAVPLNAPALIADFNAYFALFQAQRVHSLVLFDQLSQNEARQRLAGYQSFRARYNALLANPSSDAALKAATDAAAAAAVHAHDLQLEEAQRIQHLLGVGQLPTGTPITPGEIAVMTPYAASLIAVSGAQAGITAATGNIGAAKATMSAHAGVTKAPTGHQVPTAAFPMLALYDLVDP